MITLDTNLDTIRTEASTAAKDAASKFLADWTERTGGNAYGEPMYCGFGWVTIRPEHKGNTKLGKAERKKMEYLGFEKDWTGKSYQLWNVGEYHGQSMDVKVAAAEAYAEVLTRNGYRAYAGSRAD